MPTPVYDYAQLQPGETPANRSFCDTQHNPNDLAALNQMRKRLADIVARDEVFAGQGSPAIINESEPDGRHHRAVVCDRVGLGRMLDFAVVGFFGQMRPGADPTPINELDAALIADFKNYPQILSYSSLEIESGGNFGNLILLTEDAVREGWRESQVHQYAVRELSPNYYASVRLHSGNLHGGLQGGTITLARTKYYDFRDGFWCGLRAYLD